MTETANILRQGKGIEIDFQPRGDATSRRYFVASESNLVWDMTRDREVTAKTIRAQILDCYDRMKIAREAETGLLAPGKFDGESVRDLESLGVFIPDNLQTGFSREDVGEDYC